MADVIDILLVAVFVYFSLRWLAARTSRGILAGVVILGVCYAAALWLDLYLTRSLFQAGFIFLLLSIIVVLQGDIRRGFERLATFRFQLRRPVQEREPSVVGELIPAVAEMSAHRTGALMVFPGREPLERFTHGGIRVDGCLSPTLLHSIFSPQSPGHDGAILIREDRVERIGLHLPLTTNLDAIGSGGTRHAAALGLAERCDAMVVVISEERGTISVAQQGSIRPIGLDELEPLLTEHQKHRASASIVDHVGHSFGRRLPLKLASLAIAIVLWAVFAFRVESVQRDFVIPIEYRNLPSDLYVDTPPVSYATLVVAGTERTLTEMDIDSLVVSFDLSKAQRGQALRFRTRDGIQGLPKDLDLLEISPEQITVRAKAREPSAAAPAS